MALGSIVTLCGSSLFKPGWEHAAATLERAGFAVFSIHIFGHADGIDHPRAEKGLLDLVHLKKIDHSERIFVVVDQEGYYGESTEREIIWAESQGKPVVYLAYDTENDYNFLGAAYSAEGVVNGELFDIRTGEPLFAVDEPAADDVQTAVGPEAVAEVVEAPPPNSLLEDE